MRFTDYPQMDSRYWTFEAPEEKYEQAERMSRIKNKPIKPMIKVLSKSDFLEYSIYDVGVEINGVITHLSNDDARKLADDLVNAIALNSKNDARDMIVEPGDYWMGEIARTRVTITAVKEINGTVRAFGYDEFGDSHRFDRHGIFAEGQYPEMNLISRIEP